MSKRWSHPTEIDRSTITGLANPWAWASGAFVKPVNNGRTNAASEVVPKGLLTMPPTTAGRHRRVRRSWVSLHR
jgi:hypothetical protein